VATGCRGASSRNYGAFFPLGPQSWPVLAAGSVSVLLEGQRGNDARAVGSAPGCLLARLMTIMGQRPLAGNLGRLRAKTAFQQEIPRLTSRALQAEDPAGDAAALCAEMLTL